ncbi:class I SAM-dependent methyltransferase [Halosolutus gelatinilyticus]|uniref:class I SAM-dependent methyltransferase n=1 Tax=Halosolutus gelatinilyticus TaxID=2931975 RepID=UPI001FF42632|nr:class I SAM-dependent methyltransferase [Halosolutus gelatinilyticus]
MAIDRRRGADPLGRAMLAHQRGDFETLRYRDGADVQDGNVRKFYFGSSEEWADETIALLDRLADREPVLDVGCGAGQHALWWQERGVDVTAIDASPNAVRAARDRGVEDVHVMDMFDLAVDRSRFGAVHCVGTQLGLGASVAGISDLLAEFARVTDEDGIAVVDNYDPTRLDEEFFGYRPDPREGVAHRCFHFEFEEERADESRVREVGPSMHFLLCSPDRLREATIGTPWTVRSVAQPGDGTHYKAVLDKRGPGSGRDE